MKAEKITLTMTIKAEVLSFASLGGLIMDAYGLITHETPEGSIIKDDGDSIEWKTTKKKVNI